MKYSHTHDQHFLRSPQLVGELVGHSNIRKNDTVLDLGAGSGIITSTLARRCKQVIAVELEPRALAMLRKNTVQFDNVTIVPRSILQITAPEQPYKIFANIPFSLSAQIVHKFTEDVRPPKAMYLIVQKQFARKLVPGNDHFTSQLSAQLGPLYTARIRRPLRRTDFTPPPAVDTVLLELKLRDQPLLPLDQLADYRTFIEHCFAQQKFFTKTPRAASDISPELRPSQLTLEQWVALYLKFSID
jgi:23S rRNA (adenine-N6)-dimethyltransferase